ncbi:helix-turn-helix domain-containing protein [Succinimonas sp.]|uniref:helix-turn-helix domain-containing protein n=1 Tax=Succinimonas sp. TaxID=1936151 RepID=UPI0038697264
MEFKEFYSVEEAQELLNVNRDTIYRYLKKGIIESIKLGKEHRITGESLKKALTPKKR